MKHIKNNILQQKENDVTLLSMGQTLVMASAEIQKYEDKQVNSLVSQMKQLIEVDVKLNAGQHGNSDVVSPLDIMKQENFSLLISYFTKYYSKNYKGLAAVCQVTKDIPNIYWEIKINLRVVNNDGNLQDALLLAGQFELFNCEVNETIVKTVDSGLVIEDVQDKKKHLPFKIEDFMYPIQCSLLSDGIILIDPTNFEQNNSETNIQVLVSLNEKTKSFNKLGGRDVNLNTLDLLNNKAENITKQRTELLFDLLNNHKSEFTL